MRGELRAANADPAPIERADQRLTQWRDLSRSCKRHYFSRASLRVSRFFGASFE